MLYTSLSLMRCEPSAEDMASLSVKNPMEREVPLGVTVIPEGPILSSHVTHETFHLHAPDWPGLGELNLIFDVTETKRLIRERQINFSMVRMQVPREFYDHVLRNNGIEETRVAELTPADLDRPGIMVIWDGGRSSLIDGNNRLVRLYRERKPPIFKCFTVSVYDLARAQVIYDRVEDEQEIT